MRIPIFKNLVIHGVIGGDLSHKKHIKTHLHHKIQINHTALTSGKGVMNDLEKKFTGMLRKKSNLSKFKL